MLSGVSFPLHKVKEFCFLEFGIEYLFDFIARFSINDDRIRQFGGLSRDGGGRRVRSEVKDVKYRVDSKTRGKLEFHDVGTDDLNDWEGTQLSVAELF